MSYLARKLLPLLVALPLVAGLLAGCQQDTPGLAADLPKSEETQLLMLKDPNCGCCTEWADHVEHSGLTISAEDRRDMAAVKEQFGIAPEYQSCHTAVWHDHPYVFEGHVPAPLIAKFLASPPADALGLAVPGMPVGSPGMEIESHFQPYDVLLLKTDGTSSVYARITAQDQQY